MASRHMRKLQIWFHYKNFIIIMLDNDFSSKLCFEEKLSMLSLCNKCNVIFKFFSCNNDPFAAPVAFAKTPCHPFPAKQTRSSSFSPKTKSKQNRVLLKSVEVFKHYKVGFQKEKIKIFGIRAIFMFQRFICMPRDNIEPRKIMEE